MKMSTQTTQQAENFVTYLEAHRAMIREAQEGYKNAKTHEEKVRVMSSLLTKKSQLQTASPPRDAKCLFSIGSGTATIITTVTVTVG
jgi:hypothetical protein